MDRFEAMSILAAVVDTGSFTAAGRRLHMPLPSVSRKVGDLESHLGTRLLTRSTRRLALTDAGIAYVAACRRILEEVSVAERQVRGEYLAPKGELVVTAPIVFGRLHMVPTVTEFLARYPDISIRLLLSDRNAQLLDDHIDVALRIGVLADSALVALKVGQVRRVVCGSPAYLSERGTPMTPDDLVRFSCIAFDASASTSPWTFAGKSAAHDRSVPIRSSLSVNTAEAALDAAMLGAGITQVLSYQAAQGLADRRLEIILKAFAPAPLPVSLVHALQGALPLKIRSFIDFAAPRLQRRLAELPGYPHT